METEISRPFNNRLIVTNEGLLDPSLLIRTEGYMYKKGGTVNARGGYRTWKKRWFKLQEADILGHQGYELKYFDGPDRKCKGTIGLTEVELFCESLSTFFGENIKKIFFFYIIIQKIAP